MICVFFSKRDEEALKYPEDIKCCKFDNSESFKLYFFFGTNPFIKNSVLKKTYDVHVGEESNFSMAIGYFVIDLVLIAACMLLSWY